MKNYDAVLKRLEHPAGKVDVVLDTDAYNEIDDQFAISLLLKSPEKANVKAFYAAPFFNGHSTSPQDGMERSYQEILKLLKLAGREDMVPHTFRGSEGYLPDEKTPVDSPAARDLAALAMNYSPEKPLYVLAIGAISNVASAILMNPEIVDRIVLVWLAGNAYDWPNGADEFNMMQDIAGARVVFGSGAAVIQLPATDVVSNLRTTKPELTYWLKNKNPLADYLAQNTIDEAESYAAGKPWSRVIWDISSVFWLLNDDEKYMKQRIMKAPIPEYDFTYSFNENRPPMGYVWSIDRDRVFEHLFNVLGQ